MERNDDKLIGEREDWMQLHLLNHGSIATIAWLQIQRAQQKSTKAFHENQLVIWNLQ